MRCKVLALSLIYAIYYVVPSQVLVHRRECAESSTRIPQKGSCESHPEFSVPEIECLKIVTRSRRGLNRRNADMSTERVRYYIKHKRTLHKTRRELRGSQNKSRVRLSFPAKHRFRPPEDPRAHERLWQTPQVSWSLALESRLGAPLLQRPNAKPTPA